MEIRQARVVIRARNLERTRRFYEETLTFPPIETWEEEDTRGVLYQAGAMVIEVQGRAPGARTASRDEIFDYHGPNQKMTFTFIVASAEEAYRELLFRDPEVPGGLRVDRRGRRLFETHDPDGVKIFFREPDPVERARRREEPVGAAAGES